MRWEATLKVLRYMGLLVGAVTFAVHTQLRGLPLSPAQVNYK